MHELTYKAAGVDVEKAGALVADLARLRRRTEGRHKLHQAFGLFAACFDLSAYRAPVVVTGCDGVGTKILPLLEQDLLENAGMDLVAMNVNDILTTGADPLLFLDYIGIARLDPALIRRLIAGMTDALEGCECILAGGETAEMPDIVDEHLVELSGFCVGAAEKEDLLDPSTVHPGDVVVGLPSTGFHANGWSLIRKVLAAHPEAFDTARLRALLAPTRIYYPEVQAIKRERIAVKAMAHITGGGIRENLGRVLGAHGADLELPAWTNPAVQPILDAVAPEEALHAFNMGIGWMFVAAPPEADRLVATLPEARMLGMVTETKGIRIKMGGSPKPLAES